MKAYIVAGMVGLVALAGCSDGVSTPITGPVFLRIVNSTYQTTDAAGTAVATAQPRAIDVLIDESTEGAGEANIPANSVAPGTDPATGYTEMSEGLHTFTASLAAPATPRTGFFVNNATVRAEWLPKLYFTGHTNYTLVIAGVAPSEGLPSPTAFYSSSLSASFPLIDDLSAPAKVNGEYQARFRLINAAPFSPGGTTIGGTISMFLTSGSTPPTASELAALQPIGQPSAAFRGSSAYVNVTAGTYVITFTSTVGTTRIVLAQPAITFAPGEVRTFIMQNSGYAATPSSANHVLRSFIDTKY